jgi:hypothetical protein
MSALTEVEAAFVADHVMAGGPRPSVLQRRRRSGAARPGASPATREPRSSSMTGPQPAVLGVVIMPSPPAALPRPAVSPVARPQLTPRPAARPAPIRLTRRGRVVVCGLVIVAITVAALLVSLLASGGAQATNHGKAGAGYQGLHQVVVQPGQTLWSIASAAEPSADPRDVVEQIMTVNGLTSTNVPVGEELWVPR